MNIFRSLWLVTLLLCSSVHATTQQVPLSQGWNLFSLSVSDSGALATLRSHGIERLYQWNSSHKQWRHYDFIRSDGSVTQIIPQQGYWIKSPEATTLQFEGEESRNEAALLQSGWNLVALSQDDTVTSLITRLSESRPSLVLSALFHYGEGEWSKSSEEGSLSAQQLVWTYMTATGVDEQQNIEEGPPPALTFNIAGALSLQAFDSLVEDNSLLRGLQRGLNGWVENAVGRRLFRRTAQTNLVAVKESGEAVPAVESEYPVHVLYTVIDPTASYVYLVLDRSQSQALIATENCALFRVKVADNSSSCVYNGVYLQNDLTSFREIMGEERKPIQFDGAGNAYFEAAPFTVSGEGESATLNFDSWQPLVYQHRLADGITRAVTNDAQQINFFLVLEHGELIYHGTNGITAESKMWLYKDQRSYTIGDRLPDYFSTDDYRTAFWFEGRQLHLTRSRDQGGIYRAFMTLEQVPDSTFINETGTLFGLNMSSNQVTVRSILPHWTEPVAQINFNGQRRRTVPVRISEQSIYYTDQEEVPYLGEVSVIKISSLADGSTQTLFRDVRYDIYAWQLSGRNLYFSGVDLDTTTLVSGVIDTNKVKLGLPVEQFLQIRQTSSAIDSANEIHDIEVLLPKRPTTDPGGAPAVDQLVFSDDLGDVITLQFSKYMDYASVENNIKLHAPEASLEMMPLWFNRSLHLIPDIDGLGDQEQTTPLDPGWLYLVTLGEGEEGEDGESSAALEQVMDYYGNAIQATIDEQSGEADPYLGWYTRDLQQANSVSPVMTQTAIFVEPDRDFTADIKQQAFFIKPSKNDAKVDQQTLYVRAETTTSLTAETQLADYTVLAGTSLQFLLRDVETSGKTVRWSFSHQDEVLNGTSLSGYQFTAAGRYSLTIEVVDDGEIILREQRIIDVVESSDRALPTALTIPWGGQLSPIGQRTLFVNDPPVAPAITLFPDVTIDE